MTPEIDLAKLTVAEKDALILSLLPLVGQLEAALARIAELEARLARLENPPKTPDNSSLPPSKGRKSNDQPTGEKPPRKSRRGFGRALDPNPDRVVDSRLDACPHCAAAWAVEPQTPQQVYDRIELPPVKPDVTRVRLFGGRCACCGERAIAAAPEGLEPGSPFGKSIEAIAVYLHYAQAIGIETQPDHRCSRLIHDCLVTHAELHQLDGHDLGLNADGLSGPRGGAWAASTINGNRTRGTGILNNETYIGRLVWNRLRYAKEPDTGRRRSRPNNGDLVTTTEIPELRIVPQHLWEAAKARQATLERTTNDPDARSHVPRPFWSKQRPRYLFSGLMRCGECGGGFSKISADHFGCSTARNKGPTACTNRIGIRRDQLEQTVLEGLTSRLMDPDLFKLFVRRFTAEWNRQQSNLSAEREARAAELARVKQQIEKLVDALLAGTPAAALNERLRMLEQRRLELEALVATMAAPAPRLHPNLAEEYRKRIAGLAEALMRDDGTESRERIRAVVEAIELVPVDGRLEVKVRGRFPSILALATGRPRQKSASVLAEQVKSGCGETLPTFTELN